MTFSTSSKILAVKGKGKVKLAIDSPEAVQLLAVCNVAPSEVQCLNNGTPLINAWKTLVNGKEVTFCYSVKTRDNRIHIRDSVGKVTTLSHGRDHFVDELLQRFHSQPSPIQELSEDGDSASNKYLPLKEDVEAAYRMLAGQGQEISLDVLLEQIRINLTIQGVVLHDEWQIKTEANIVLWSI